jgi:hypothetical protein
MRLHFKNFYLLLLLIAAFQSCMKNDFSDDRVIMESVENIKIEKDLYILRLCFGKTVARALAEKEFRDYIKNQSRKPDKHVFEYLIYQRIKKDLLPSGKTVEQLLRQYVDEEVRDILGESMFDRLAEEDRMVSLKLPDMFINVEWDTEMVVPFVGVETPWDLGSGAYMYFYHNGYSEIFFDRSYSSLKYFSIAITYCSDYLYLNELTMANEKGISFFEFFPQSRNCKNRDIVSEIMGLKEQDIENEYWSYIPKSIAYDLWRDNCTYQEVIYIYDEVFPCGQSGIVCPRDCAIGSPMINKVFLNEVKFVKNHLPLIFGSGIFDETYHFSFKYTNRDNRDDYKIIMVPAVRLADLNFFTVNGSIKLNSVDRRGSCFDVPLLNLKIEEHIEKSTPFAINALFDDSFLNDNRTYVVCSEAHIYSDILFTNEYCGGHTGYNSTWTTWLNNIIFVTWCNPYYPHAFSETDATVVKIRF